MKDIHTHLLYGIDDGSKTIDQSIELIKNLYTNGTTDIVLTPHYMNDTNYNTNNSKKNKLLKELNSKLKDNNININLYIGNEIYFTENILDLIKKKEISTINNSKYLLIELPMSYLPNIVINIFEELIYNGYKIILAHPERYGYLTLDEISELKDMGILLQGNYLSLYNEYGKRSKKVLKKLIKLGWIDFLASDIHRSEIKIDENKLTKKLRRYTSKQKIDEILYENFDKVIKNF